MFFKSQKNSTNKLNKFSLQIYCALTVKVTLKNLTTHNSDHVKSENFRQLIFFVVKNAELNCLQLFI